MADPLSSHLEALPEEERTRLGVTVGPGGVHTSRALMLADLRVLLAPGAPDDLRGAIVEGNLLSRDRHGTRLAAAEKLHRLYGLDPGLPLFRVLHRLWRLDEPGRPVLALLVALARDPLLRAAAPPVLGTAVGEAVDPARVEAALNEAVGGRLTPLTLGRSAKRVLHSFHQSGHLRGARTRVRAAVEPTPGSAALALWLARLGDTPPAAALRSPWTRVTDGGPDAFAAAARGAATLGLLRLRVSEDSVELDLRGLDPAEAPSAAGATR